MSKTTEQIQNHLEFLGYKIERVSPQKEGEKEFFQATNPNKFFFTYFEIFPNFVLFKISFNYKSKQSAEMDAAINVANLLMNINKVYYQTPDGDVVLRFEATYVGDYVKEVFARFFDYFERDQRICFDNDVFKKAFSE